jgi:Na+-translocating ferredoxin:NAD+ oxidoreductase RnfE subunit
VAGMAEEAVVVVVVVDMVVSSQRKFIHHSTRVHVMLIDSTRIARTL